MKGIVLIPCWRRPEFLAITLNRLASNKHWAEYLLYFHLDEGYDPDIFTVIANMYAEDTLGPIKYRINILLERKGLGNDFNILNALSNGLEAANEFGVDIIHLLEEDIFVGSDYLRFHEQAHKQFKPFAVSACLNQHKKIRPPNNYSHVYLSEDYQSLGVSFSKDSLKSILLHTGDDCYFLDREKYCRLLFPNSRFGTLFPECDGLIARIIEADHHKVVYPFTPRAYHAGFIGMHRPGKELEGDLTERIKTLENMTDVEMNARADVKDIRACDLGYIEPTELVLREFYE